MTNSLWMFIPLLGNIRVSTIIIFSSIFLYLLWKLRIEGKTALYQSIVTVLFLASLYEIIFLVIEASILNWHFPVWEILALTGWVLLGLKEGMRRFELTKLSTLFLTGFITGLIVWIAIGFPTNTPLDTRIHIPGEILNILTKSLLPYGYVLGLKNIQ